MLTSISFNTKGHLMTEIEKGTLHRAFSIFLFNNKVIQAMIFNAHSCRASSFCSKEQVRRSLFQITGQTLAAHIQSTFPIRESLSRRLSLVWCWRFGDSWRADVFLIEKKEFDVLQRESSNMRWTSSCLRRPSILLLASCIRLLRMEFLESMSVWSNCRCCCCCIWDYFSSRLCVVCTCGICFRE